MTTPAFLDGTRPDVPDIVVPRGITPFHFAGRPVRGPPRPPRCIGRRVADPAHAPSSGDASGRRGARALAAALASALKFRGSFSLQAKGDGAVPMLLADCTEAGALRGYTRTQPEKLAAVLGDPAAPDAKARAARPARQGLPRVHRRPGGASGSAIKASSRSRARAWLTWRRTISTPASSCNASCGWLATLHRLAGGRLR